MPWPKIDSAYDRVSGGRSHPYARPQMWKRVVNPQKNSQPPRPRPTLFFYVFTLIYSQAGFTRKFRHYLPCQHNITYFAIPDQSKRHLYALGSDCAMCAFCEETLVCHTHLSIFQCPLDANCPKTSKVPPQSIDAKIQHACYQHQAHVPHPLDLNSITNPPVPLGAPSQFSFHSSFPMDSMLVAQALQEKGTLGNNPGPVFPPPRSEMGMINVNDPPVNSARPPMCPPPMCPPPPSRCVAQCGCPPPPYRKAPTPFPFRRPHTPPPSPVREQVEESVDIVEVEIALDRAKDVANQD
jgi:hypothetical protein